MATVHTTGMTPGGLWLNYIEKVVGRVLHENMTVSAWIAPKFVGEMDFIVDGEDVTVQEIVLVLHVTVQDGTGLHSTYEGEISSRIVPVKDAMEQIVGSMKKWARQIAERSDEYGRIDRNRMHEIGVDL